MQLKLNHSSGARRSAIACVGSIFGVALTLLAFSHVAEASEKDNGVVVLTDSTFEHDTQAASGMTTGPWFVKFYAPWCYYCKQVAPIWIAFAEDIGEQMNVAELDAVENGITRERFDIHGFPTFYLFIDNAMYEYTGERTVEAFKEFALGGYNSLSKTVIPPVPSWFDRLFSTTVTIVA